jgi:hypothetical protein
MHQRPMPMLRASLIHRLALLLLPAVAAAALSACCPCRMTQQAAPVARVAPFTIEFSDGGGFSNLHTGYVFHDDGSVLFWQGFNAQKESTRDLGRVPLEKIREVQRLIDDGGLMDAALHETGNMTVTLRISEGERVSTLTWPGTMNDGESVPLPARPLFAPLHELLRLAQDGAAR